MKIKKFLLMIMVFLGSLFASDGFTKKATIPPQLVQQGKEKMWCNVCGMNLKMFYKTSHAAKTKEGMHQYCSIHCLVADMQKNKIDKDSVQVVDAQTQKLIPAVTAYYVVGSKIKGTMSKVSKIAFGSKKDAQSFVQQYGGEIVSFDKALSLAKEALTKDMKMISMKKQKKIYPMGKKIYEKKCHKFDVDFSKYKSINELKADIKAKCSHLPEKPLQAMSLYLWDVKRTNATTQNLPEIIVTKEDKCPVCGMFVYKYPKWAAQIFYGDKHLSFDGVKDLMKYYFKHKDGADVILVRDYYTQKTIDAKKAFYVVGSTVYGPMGNELIPFASKEAAKTFYMDHQGKKILSFDEITPEIVKALDE